jgi:hypothetical protein
MQQTVVFFLLIVTEQGYTVIEAYSTKPNL